RCTRARGRAEGGADRGGGAGLAGRPAHGGRPACQCQERRTASRPAASARPETLGRRSRAAEHHIGTERPALARSLRVPAGITENLIMLSPQALRDSWSGAAPVPFWLDRADRLTAGPRRLCRVGTCPHRTP